MARRRWIAGARRVIAGNRTRSGLRPFRRAVLTRTLRALPRRRVARKATRRRR